MQMKKTKTEERNSLRSLFRKVKIRRSRLKNFGFYFGYIHTVIFNIVRYADLIIKRRHVPRPFFLLFSFSYIELFSSIVCFTFLIMVNTGYSHLRFLFYLFLYQVTNFFQYCMLRIFSKVKTFNIVCFALYFKQQGSVHTLAPQVAETQERCGVFIWRCMA